MSTYTSISNTPLPAEKKNILTELEETERTLAGLMDAVRVLRERISTVSVPEEEGPVLTAREPAGGISPLRMRIIVIGGQVDAILRMMGDILHTLDL